MLLGIYLQIINDPVLMAIAAAICMGLANQFQFSGLEAADYMRGTFVVTGTCCLAYWCFAPFVLESWYWTTWAALLFAVVGIFRPAFTIMLTLRSNSIIGPTLTSAFAATAPLFAVFAAVFAFGEVLTLHMAIGTFLVVLSVALLSGRTEATDLRWRWYAVFLPLGVAVLRAASHSVTKLGLSEVPSAFFASLVGISVSWLVIAVIYRQRSAILQRNKSSDLYFIASGLLSAGGIYLFNVALIKGSLLIVVPIATAVPVFTLIIGKLVFKREQLSKVALAIVVLVIIGTAILSINGKV